MQPFIVGLGHTQFGALSERTLEDLTVQAGREALEHAGVAPGEVGGIWLGHFNSGMVADGFPASLALNIDDDLRFVPATRCENACASGSAAVYAALDAVRSGRVQIALVIGVEKMTELDTAGVTAALSGASYQKEEAGVSFPQIFGRIAGQYFQRFGDQSATLARIAVKNHTNALRNPLAHMHKEISFDFANHVSEKNPMIAQPLRMTDCSLISDGAAALVLVAEDLAKNFPQAVRIRATAQVNDFLPMSRRDMTELTGAARAFNTVLTEGEVDLADIKFAEVHDCFTIAELMIYEAMGLTPKGRGADAIADGTVMADGRLPVNLSGGLKAKGHPVGATGVSMHVMAARQLTGDAGEMQKADADLGLVFNMGGSGVANYCTLLEAVS